MSQGTVHDYHQTEPIDILVRKTGDEILPHLGGFIELIIGVGGRDIFLSVVAFGKVHVPIEKPLAIRKHIDTHSLTYTAEDQCHSLAQQQPLFIPYLAPEDSLASLSPRLSREVLGGPTGPQL